MLLSLPSITNDNILKVLKKVDFQTLTNIRQTNSSMETLVYNHRNGLKKKIKDHTKLSISIPFDLSGETNVVYHLIRDCDQFELIDPSTQLSAVHIDKLKIKVGMLNSKEEERIITNEILQVLEKLRLEPENINLRLCSRKFADEALDILPISKKISLSYPGRLNNSQEPLIFNYNKMKKYSHVKVFSAGIHMTHEFINDILDDLSLRQLRCVEFHFSSLNLFICSILETLPGGLPPGMCFDISGIRNDFCRMRWVDGDKIYAVDNQDKWVVISEDIGNALCVMCCEKSPEALLKTLAEIVYGTKQIDIDVSSHLVEFSLALSDEERNAVFERLCKSIMRDCIRKKPQESKGVTRHIAAWRPAQKPPQPPRPPQAMQALPRTKSTFRSFISRAFKSLSFK